MNKLVKIATICVVAMLLCTAPAMAQPAAPAAPAAPTYTPPLVDLGGAFGAGLVCIGSAFGIGKLAAAALESMARQPEVAGNIQTAMIIAAALIEGFTFYALFICSTQIAQLPDFTP